MCVCVCVCARARVCACACVRVCVFESSPAEHWLRKQECLASAVPSTYSSSVWWEDGGSSRGEVVGEVKVDWFGRFKQIFLNVSSVSVIVG